MVLWHFTKSSQNRLDLFSLELPLTLSMAAGWGRRNRYKSRPLGSRFQQWRLWRPTRPLNIWFTNKNTLKCLKSFIPRFDDWKAFNIQNSGKFVHQPYLCPSMRLSSSAHWEISKYPSKRNADHCFVSRKSSSQPRLSETPTAFCPQWWVDIRIGMSFHLLPHPYHWISLNSTLGSVYWKNISQSPRNHPRYFLLERFVFVSSLADAFAAGFAPENGGSAPGCRRPSNDTPWLEDAWIKMDEVWLAKCI